MFKYQFVSSETYFGPVISTVPCLAANTEHKMEVVPIFQLCIEYLHFIQYFLKMTIDLLGELIQLDFIGVIAWRIKAGPVLTNGDGVSL